MLWKFIIRPSLIDRFVKSSDLVGGWIWDDLVDIRLIEWSSDTIELRRQLFLSVFSWHVGFDIGECCGIECCWEVWLSKSSLFQFTTFFWVLMQHLVQSSLFNLFPISSLAHLIILTLLLTHFLFHNHTHRHRILIIISMCATNGPFLNRLSNHFIPHHNSTATTFLLHLRTTTNILLRLWFTYLGDESASIITFQLLAIIDFFISRLTCEHFPQTLIVILSTFVPSWLHWFP